ncbi:MAG TPA: hypothetical protein VF076_03840, partial [Acidimicrobiales bacterium]
MQQVIMQQSVSELAGRGAKRWSASNAEAPGLLPLDPDCGGRDAGLACRRRSVAELGTTTGETLPTLPAMTCHAHRPSTRPAGTPTPSAVAATA